MTTVLIRRVIRLLVACALPAIFGTCQNNGAPSSETQGHDSPSSPIKLNDEERLVTCESAGERQSVSEVREGPEAGCAETTHRDKDEVLELVAQYPSFDDTQDAAGMITACLARHGIKALIFGSRACDVTVRTRDAERARELIRELRKEQNLYVTVFDEQGRPIID